MQNVRIVVCQCEEDEERAEVEEGREEGEEGEEEGAFVDVVMLQC